MDNTLDIATSYILYVMQPPTIEGYQHISDGGGQSKCSLMKKVLQTLYDVAGRAYSTMHFNCNGSEVWYNVEL